MERKNRTILTLMIAAVMVAAVLSSFGLPGFFKKLPVIVLPETDPGGEPGVTSDPGQTEGGYLRVEVTAETVQSVIETLERPVSYYREISFESIWGEEAGEQGVIPVRTWVDGGYTRVEATLPGGRIQHSIAGPDRYYLWYDGDSSWKSWPVEEGTADLIQRIPTYEEILTLEPDMILDTGYVEKGGVACVYVEVRTDGLGYVRRYWVSTESGLLVAAETLKEGRTVLRMSSYMMHAPVPEETSFTLPDGTALHTALQRPAQ